ncbi:phosphotransferase family protein [Hydrogenophaga sp.]|uniref:phosphotransferase family protein n=1 Tax=Hydrogenophaga sp. TaxID=1904254 RepID=UPI0027259428|nr:phosphotransferase family protein [Hydrogenophaga sp.]MDO9504296.1 phosphotransferase family protein [Hydrogenophaga sp.]
MDAPNNQCAGTLAASVQRAMVRHGSGEGEVVNLRRLTGGATKQTWAFDWVRASVQKPLIFQQFPAPVSPSKGVPKLKASQDAAVMLVARAGGAPAPVVRLVLEPADGMGEGYVTEFVAGETLGRRVVRDEAFAPARQAMASQCGTILAAIHRLPTDSLPFLQQLSPVDELKVYGDSLAGCGVRHPALSYALRWVEENLPQRWTPAVVHADFRTGNLIVGPDGVRCVLDWEIARIGDAMQDLGVLCMRSWRFGGSGEVGGFGEREDLYVAYEAASGQAVDPQRVRFWEAFSNLKWAIACARRGASQRPDGRQISVELSAVGRRMEEPLWDFLSLTGATPGSIR